MRPIIERQKPVDEAEVAADQIIAAMNGQFNQVVQTHKACFERFWRSFGASPAEIAESLGTDGVKMMMAAGASAQFIRGLANALELPLEDFIEESDLVPPLPVTLNEDGTITIGERPTR